MLAHSKCVEWLGNTAPTNMSEPSDLLDDFEVFCAISRHGSLRERGCTWGSEGHRRRQGSCGEEKLRRIQYRRGSRDSPGKARRLRSPNVRMDPEGDTREEDKPSPRVSPNGEEYPRRPSNFSDTTRRRMDRHFSHTGKSLYEDDEWDMGAMRPRVSSMPARTLTKRARVPSLARLRSNNSPDMHRVRAFTITSHGVVSDGDKYVSNSSVSVASTESEAPSLTPDGSHDTPTPSLRVLVVGDHGVGKKALIHKFLSSGDSSATTSLGRLLLLVITSRKSLTATFP